MMDNMNNDLRTTQVTNMSQLKNGISVFGELQDEEELKVYQIGHYTFQKDSKHKLGKGTFGSVYRATSQKDGKEYAIKVVKRETPLNFQMEKEQSRVKNEMELLIQLNSQECEEHLIKFYDYYETKEHHYLVLELCENSVDLDDYMKEKDINENLALLIFYQTLKGIQYMQKKQIVHRDIKPSNLLFLKKTGKIKIIDLGMAKQVVDERSMSVQGAPIYMAPELFIDKGTYVKDYEIACKIDIWSSGIMLYELLFKYPPWKNWSNLQIEELKEIIYKFKTDKSELQFPKNIPISNETKQIIQNCLVYNPEQRYSVDQLLELEPFKKWSNNQKHEKFTQNFTELNVGELMTDIINDFDKQQNIFSNFVDVLTEDQIDSYYNKIMQEKENITIIKSEENSEEQNTEQQQQQQQQLTQEEIQKQINTQSLKHFKTYKNIYQLFQKEDFTPYDKILEQIQTTLEPFKLDINCLYFSKFCFYKLINLMGDIIVNYDNDFRQSFQKIPFFENILKQNLRNFNQDIKEEKNIKQYQYKLADFFDENKNFCNDWKYFKKQNESISFKVKKMHNDEIDSYLDTLTKQSDNQTILHPQFQSAQEQQKHFNDQVQKIEKQLLCQTEELRYDHEFLEELIISFLSSNILIIQKYLYELDSNQENFRDEILFQIINIFEFFKTQIFFDENEDFKQFEDNFDCVKNLISKYEEFSNQNFQEYMYEQQEIIYNSLNKHLLNIK